MQLMLIINPLTISVNFCFLPLATPSILAILLLVCVSGLELVHLFFYTPKLSWFCSSLLDET